MEHAPQIYKSILSVEDSREDALYRLIDIHHILWKDCYAVQDAGPIIGPLPTECWYFKPIQFIGPKKYEEPLLLTFSSDLSNYQGNSSFSPESTVVLGGDYEIPREYLYDWLNTKNRPDYAGLPENLPLNQYLARQYKESLLADIVKIWEFVKRTLAQLEAYGYWFSF